jgi:heme exporter protein D
MYFDSLSSAMHMDGHGVFVWSAYFIAILVMSYLVIQPMRKEKQVIRQLQSALKRQERDKLNASSS